MVAFELIKYFTQLSQPFLSFLFSLRMRKEMKRKELRCLLPKGTVQLIQFLLKKLIGCCSCGELNGFGFCFFLCWGVMAAAAAMLRNKRENKTKNQIQIQQKEEKWVNWLSGMKRIEKWTLRMKWIKWMNQTRQWREGKERPTKPPTVARQAKANQLFFTNSLHKKKWSESWLKRKDVFAAERAFFFFLLLFNQTNHPSIAALWASNWLDWLFSSFLLINGGYGRGRPSCSGSIPFQKS